MPSARPVASVTLSFGLVAIPVNLYSATAPSQRISFNFVRARDGSRVRQRYVAVNDGKLVDRAQMAKGYEFAKDQFVVFSPQELKELEEKTSNSIDISEFVPLETVDPIYFASAYLLAPDKGGAKPYSLLAAALTKSRQCAIGRWVSRGKEHIVVIRPFSDALALHQLHFQDEIRSAKELEIHLESVSDGELKLAGQLIEHLAVKKFNPGEFTDEFKARVEAAIQRKLQGKEVSVAKGKPAPRGGNVIDLMQALKASLHVIGDAAVSRAPRRAGSGPARKASRR
jgi:DNA end-binding protein Ku